MYKLRIYLAIVWLLAIVCSVYTQGTKSLKTKKHQTEKTSMDKSEQKNPVAHVETSMGNFDMELFSSDAPKTVENFVGLAQKKFFDGMRVHRVAKGFVIQTGDDKSKDQSKVGEWGTGGQSIWGKQFEDELNANSPSYKEGYKAGVVAMANRGPNTNTSQFFVCLKDINLPHAYTIFGKVTKGMDVVEKIGQVDIIPGPMGMTDGRPKTDVMIKHVSVKK